VISEVHPSVIRGGTSVEAHEWIEIHNLERHSVNLSGWMVEDAQAISQLPDLALGAGKTAIIVGHSADIVVPAGKTLIMLETPRIGTGLRDAGDRIALINPNGVRHDAVSWGDVRWPRHSDQPNPGQAIIRTARGGQALADQLTPWTVTEDVSAETQRHRHPPPDTLVRIVEALIDPIDEEEESVTIRNISDKPLLTVNWTMTVGNSLVRLRSVRIEPGASYVITEPDAEIGSGMSPGGGHLVLRDARGNWLSTASWGEDRTFHDLSSPSSGQYLRFSHMTRVYPRVPWSDFVDFSNRRLVLGETGPGPLNGSNISLTTARAAPVSWQHQESEDGQLWISEVYPTAGQGRNDAAFEWFELTNSSSLPAILNGWFIADNTSSDPLDGVTIPPGASVAIGASSQAGPEVLVAISDGRIGNGLANAGDQLRLVSPDGEVVSAISWGSDRTFSSVSAPKSDQALHRGSSEDHPTVARPSPGILTSLREAATNLAPPVQAEPNVLAPSIAPDEEGHTTNEVANRNEFDPGELGTLPPVLLRITEILPAPLPGEAEWIEIHNPTEQPIDLTGWSIGDAERRTELAGSIAAGARFVISTRELGAGLADLVVTRIGNGLNNDADTISIFNPDGLEVHEINYGTRSLPAPDRGLSIALEPERWVVTAAPTPGSAEVTPLLGEALRSASAKAPISDADRLPLVESTPGNGVNAWMIVSVALIGVIMTLVVRRWRPEEELAEASPEPTTYSGTSVPTNDELERSDETHQR
jgi:hypothetical protein